ncbi:uncharacterized protein [Onthophagus taurus]|uniref:uncharacterized protein n=1 Tax=Onthophagus taurus TaxID=166361 RepID=UPI0039BDD9C6
MFSLIISCVITSSFIFDGVPGQSFYGLSEHFEMLPYIKRTNNGKLYTKPPFSFVCPEGFINHNGTNCVQEKYGACPDIKNLKFSISPFERSPEAMIGSNCSYSISNVLKEHAKKDSLVNLQLFFDNGYYPYKLYLDVTKEMDLIDDFSDKIFCWVNRHHSKLINTSQIFKNVTKSRKTYRFLLKLTQKLSSYVCHFIFPPNFKPSFSNVVFAMNNRKHTFFVEYRKSYRNAMVKVEDDAFLNNRYNWGEKNQIIFATNFSDLELVKKEVVEKFGVNISRLSQELFCDPAWEIISGKNISWPKTKMLSISYPNNIICTDSKNKSLYRRCDKNSTWSKSIGDCNISYDINDLNLHSDINEIELIKLINVLSTRRVNKSLIDKIEEIFDVDLKLLPPHLINKLIDESKQFFDQFKNVENLEINETYISNDLNVTFPKNLLNPTNSASLIIFNKKNELIVDIDVNNKCNVFFDPIILTFQNKNNNKLKCVYWDYYYNTWSDIGIITKLNNNLIECHSYHLTRFSLIIIDEEIVNEFHSKSIHTITLIELGISLIGVFIILIIAILSRDWRKMRWNVVHLSFVIFLQLSLLILTIFGINLKSYCVYLGAGLHLLVLVKLCVCFLIAKTKFRDFVLVLKRVKKMRTKISCRSVLLTWICPGVIVGVSLTFFREDYKENEFHYCYPQKKLFIYAVFVPVSVLVLVISSIFIFLMFKVFQLKIKNVAQRMARIKLAMMLWFLLGLTWLFSILVEILPEGYFRTICYYIFTFVAPLEGFIVFIFYVILDKSTKFYWFSAAKATS